LEKPNDKEEPDVLCGFVNKVVGERNKGRSLVFVDDKLLEWVDKLVDSGEYLSRSHVIECALVEMKERGKSNVNLKGPSHDSADTTKGHSRGWTAGDNLLVSISKYSLNKVLDTRFGDDDEAKIQALQRALERADQGSINMPWPRRKAFAEILSQLKQK
jgi:Arc/MetJ-type ribon-helix-helix transcriptional regulator